MHYILHTHPFCTTAKYQAYARCVVALQVPFQPCSRLACNSTTSLKTADTGSKQQPIAVVATTRGQGMGIIPIPFALHYMPGLRGWVRPRPRSSNTGSVAASSQAETQGERLTISARCQSYTGAPAGACRPLLYSTCCSDQWHGSYCQSS